MAQEGVEAAVYLPGGSDTFRGVTGRRRRSRWGDWWRSCVVGVVCFLSIVPLIMALIVSLKAPSQFARVPFWPTMPLRWENYAFAWMIVREFMLNSIICSGATVIGVLFLGSLSAYSFAVIEFPGRRLVFYAVLALMMVPSSLTLVPSFVLVKDLGLINTRWSLILPWISGGQLMTILMYRWCLGLADILLGRLAVGQAYAGGGSYTEYPGHLEQPDLAIPYYLVS